MFDLTGKTALITGASGGIGGAIALAMAGQGANLVLNGRREDALNKTASSLTLKGDARVEIIPMDLAEIDAAGALIAEAEARLGGVDILVNNAGLTRDGLLVRMSAEDWQQVLEVNLSAVMRLSKAALRGMMKARWGRIIQISSVVGYTGNAGQTNYAASKAALQGFTKSLALEVASRGVTANLIAPGFIETPMTDGLNEAQVAKALERVPMASMGKPQDIAAAAVFLASAEAGYMTGASLHVNGGMAMI